MSKNDLLNVKIIQKCSKRACEYMFACKAIHEPMEDHSHPIDSSTLTMTSSVNKKWMPMSYNIIKKSIKVCKTHQSCLDTDLKWVKNMNEELGKKKIGTVRSAVLKMENIKCK